MPLETGHGFVTGQSHDFKKVICRPAEIVQSAVTKDHEKQRSGSLLFGKQ